MGHPLSSLSLRNAEDNALFMTSALGAFANVTDLNLQIDGRGRTQGHHYSVPDLGNLFVMLPAMHHLSCLSLGFTHLELHADETKRLLAGLKSQTLTYLRLRSVRFYMDDMIQLFFTHRATPKAVSFHNVGFEGSTQESWKALIRRVEWFTNTKHAAFIECFEWRMFDESTKVRVKNTDGKRLAQRLVAQAGWGQ